MSHESGSAVSERGAVPEQGVARDSGGTYQVVKDVDGPLHVDDVRERWTDFMDALRPRDLKLEAFMRDAEPVRVEDNVVILSFVHKFHRTKVEEDEKRHTVEDIFSDIFSRKVRVRCETHRPGEARVAQDKAQRSKQEWAAEEHDVSADPLVRMAVDELGAEVVGGRA